MVSAVLLHWLATWICVAVGLPWVKYLFGSMPTAMVGLGLQTPDSALLGAV